MCIYTYVYRCVDRYVCTVYVYVRVTYQDAQKGALKSEKILHKREEKNKVTLGRYSHSFLPRGSERRVVVKGGMIMI